MKTLTKIAMMVIVLAVGLVPMVGCDDASTPGLPRGGAEEIPPEPQRTTAQLPRPSDNAVPTEASGELASHTPECPKYTRAGAYDCASSHPVARVTITVEDDDEDSFVGNDGEEIRDASDRVICTAHMTTNEVPGGEREFTLALSRSGYFRGKPSEHWDGEVRLERRFHDSNRADYDSSDWEWKDEMTLAPPNNHSTVRVRARLYPDEGSPIYIDNGGIVLRVDDRGTRATLGTPFDCRRTG